jgi:hypothetical protein
MAENLIAQQCLLEVFYTEFQQNVWNSYWGTGKSPFMISHNVGSIMNQ